MLLRFAIIGVGFVAMEFMDTPELSASVQERKVSE
jgi:hypothetical protein